MDNNLSNIRTNIHLDPKEVTTVNFGHPQYDVEIKKNVSYQTEYNESYSYLDINFPSLERLSSSDVKIVKGNPFCVEKISSLPDCGISCSLNSTGDKLLTCTNNRVIMFVKRGNKWITQITIMALQPKCMFAASSDTYCILTSRNLLLSDGKVDHSISFREKALEFDMSSDGSSVAVRNQKSVVVYDYTLNTLHSRPISPLAICLEGEYLGCLFADRVELYRNATLEKTFPIAESRDRIFLNESVTKFIISNSSKLDIYTIEDGSANSQSFSGEIQSIQFNPTLTRACAFSTCQDTRILSLLQIEDDHLGLIAGFNLSTNGSNLDCSLNSNGSMYVGCFNSESASSIYVLTGNDSKSPFFTAVSNRPEVTIEDKSRTSFKLSVDGATYDLVVDENYTKVVSMSIESNLLLDSFICDRRAFLGEVPEYENYNLESKQHEEVQPAKGIRVLSWFGF